MQCSKGLVNEIQRKDLYFNGDITWFILPYFTSSEDPIKCACTRGP